MRKSFKDVAWRLPGFLVVWLFFMAMKIGFVLHGFVMVALLYFYRKRKFDDVPQIFLPWQNPEDWVGGINGTEHSLPQWWINKEGTGFYSWWKYHAIRNPANGLRNFDFVDLDLEQDKIHYWTPEYLKYYEQWYLQKYAPDLKTYGYIAWQGWRAGLKIEHIWNAKRYFVFKFGWRLEPRDAEEGYKKNSHRWNLGAGFASKFLPFREL